MSLYGGHRGTPSIGGSKTNSQVIHIWAQGKGKKARGGNIRCEDDCLYSYSTMIARWYDLPKNKRCTVVTSKTYSVTTSGKHMPRYCDMPGNHPVYYFHGDVDDLPNDWSEARKVLLKQQVTQLDPMIEALHKMTSMRSYSLESVFAHARKVDTFATEHKLRSLISKDARITSSAMHDNPLEWIESFDALLADRCRRQLEKTAERDRVRDEQRRAQYERNREAWEKQNAERARIAAMKKEEKIAEWRAGNLPSHLFNDAPMMLRINGKEIETSHGARITIDEARAFFPQLHRRSITQGEPVGHFRFQAVTGDNVIIGCHTIPLVEIYRIAAELGMIQENETPLTQ